MGNVFNADIKGYIVDEARAMNLNSFRTHTSPPPHLWLNVADEHGTFILAEFPVLYNYGNFKFTREEKEVFHRNAILDATGWVTSLWNHPSVAMWVLSNESPGDHSWEAGPFRDHVVGLDPTRVTMRTGVGSGTKSTVDVHTCGNWTRNTETHWLQVFERHMARKDPKRVLTNSEYMNNFGDPAVKWLGRSKHPDTGLAKAEFCLEHTEGMRRLGYDGMIAYMYAGWTRIRGRNNWRQDYPTPMAAALHSSMAPVLASLEIVDRNYLPNQKMTTRVALLSDELVDVPGTIDVYVTPKHPLFVPDADALKAAVWKTSFKRTFKATSTDSMDLEWSLPEKEGVYYLAAVLSRKGDKPVVSQRIVRAIRPTRDALKGRKVLVLGGEQVTIDWLKRQGATVFDALEGADVVLIWDIDKVPEDARKQAGALKKYVEAGGRIVILEQHHWTWPELVDFKIGRALSSRAFAYPNVKHPMLKDIDPDYLKRWNGMPNAVATRVIEGPALKQGKKLLWAEAPSKTIALSMPTGKGEVLVTTLQIKHRITRRNQGYDPVAERMLANLLR